jgi:tellurite resistance protein TerC
MAVVIWIAFIAMVVAFLALDLGVFHRRPHAISIKEALAWTAFWVALALVFNGFVYLFYEHHWLDFGTSLRQELDGGEAALKFFTGYVVEKSLSVDNIFVIAMIFAYFGVPLQYQHRVLFWGILGALVLRGLMVVAGTALIAKFSWMTYIFGGFLLLTAGKLLVTRHDNLVPERNLLVRWARKMYPVSSDFEGSRFFTLVDGKRAVTPLFLTLLVIESSDVVFAVDSIPAIFAITRDSFIVFTSNVFAILGLRSLYFAVAGMIARFRFLKMSLVFLLAFIGVKMLLAHHHPIPTVVSLAIIGGILGVGVIASVFASHLDTAPLESPLADDLERLAMVSLRQARRIVVLIAGSTVLILGVAMLFLPGPGILATWGGLAILAIEFVWAKRWLARVKKVYERTKIAAGLERRHRMGRVKNLVHSRKTQFRESEPSSVDEKL